MQVFVYFLLLWFGFTGTFDCLERHVSEMTCYVLSEMLARFSLAELTGDRFPLPVNVDGPSTRVVETGLYSLQCICLLHVGTSVVGLPMWWRHRAPSRAGFQEDAAAADSTGAVGSVAWTSCQRRFGTLCFESGLPRQSATISHEVVILQVGQCLLSALLIIIQTWKA